MGHEAFRSNSLHRIGYSGGWGGEMPISLRAEWQRVQTFCQMP